MVLILAQALEIIQRNERGRQGKQRALLLKELREEEKKRRIYDATDQLEMDPEIAAANIQVKWGGVNNAGGLEPGCPNSAGEITGHRPNHHFMLYIEKRPSL